MIDLHVIDGGALTGISYRDEILHPIARPFAVAVGEDFILMDDNARPHRALVVNVYLEAETVVRMEWPSRSSDLNKPHRNCLRHVPVQGIFPSKTPRHYENMPIYC